MSLFPFLDNPQENIQIIKDNDLPMFKEYAFDFELNEIIISNGREVILEGLEAVKIWAYKALNTPRFRYLAYTWNYGQEFDNLIGSTYSKKVSESEGKRYLEECLLINPYITGVKNVNISSIEDRLNIDFIMVTIYGETPMGI